MKAYCICTGSEASVAGATKLSESHADVGNDFMLIGFPASTPETVDAEMAERGIVWTYPWDEPTEIAGLRLHPYKTTNRLARMACFMSHYRLWERVLMEGTLLIMEDDAIFIENANDLHLVDPAYRIVGINDPRGATRRADAFHERVALCGADDPHAIAVEPCDAPWVDEVQVPQGLAGASAYWMNCDGARSAMEMVSKHGAWPNDALLCKQLIPGLGQTKTYYTKVQRTRSSLA